MARWAYILHLTHQLLWTRRGAQRIVASVCVTGIALGLPLAWATLHWREAIREILAEIGVQAFPVEVLDMTLPAHTTPGLYLTHTFFTFAMVLLSSVPALRLILRMSSHAPQQ